MRMSDAVVLVAVGAFFLLLGVKRPQQENDETERVDVNEVVDAETQAKGSVAWRGEPVSVVLFNSTYNIGTIDGGVFYAETGNTSRRTTFTTLADAVKVAKERNNPPSNKPNEPQKPEENLPPADNPYDRIGGFDGFGQNQRPSFGW